MKDKRGRKIQVGDWVETEGGHVFEVVDESGFFEGVILARNVYQNGFTQSLNANEVTRVATKKEREQ